MATEELKIVLSVEAQEAINKVKAVKQEISDLGNTSGTAKVKTAMADSTKEIEKLKDTLSKIPGVGGTVAASFAKIAAAVLVIRSSLKWVKMAIGEFFSAFDFKNFDVGDDGFKGIIESMKISFKEAGVSMAQAFGKGKAAAKGAAAASGEAGAAASGAGAAAGGAAAGGFAALAAAVAVVAAAVASLVVAVKNAVRYSAELKTLFFESHKVGMTAASYQELSYVLGQVGVEADKLSDFIKSLSAAQNDLRDGSEGMVNAFKALGISVEEATSMTQEELFITTIQRLQQMEDAIERTGIAYRIFGEDDAAEVANLMALNNEEMERMINNFYLLGGGASDAAVQKSLQLQSALSNLRLAWQGLGNTLGEVIMPALTAVVNALAKAIAVVNMFLRTIFGLDVVAKGSKSVNKASASVGGYSSSLKDAAKSAEQLKRSTMGFDELNVVPSGKSAAGGSDADYGGGGGGGGIEIPDLSGMTADLGLDKWAEHFEKFKTAYQTWVPIALSAIGIALAIIGFCTGNVPLGIAGIGLAGLGITVGFQNGLWAKLLKGAQNAFKNFGAWFKKIWGEVANWWKKTWNNIKTTASNIWKAIAKFFTDCWNGVKTTAIKVWNAIADFFKKLWDGIKTTAVNAWNGIKKFFSDTWNAIKTTATNAWNAIKKFFSDTWNSIKSTATTIWNTVAKFFSDTWNSIKTTATNAWNNIKTFLTNLWNGLKTTATTIWNAIAKFFSDTWNSIKTTATTVWNAIIKFLSDAWNSIKTTATNAWNGIKTMLENTWNTIKTKASELCDKLKEFFSNAWDAIKKVWDVVKGYFQGIWDAIKTGASTLTDNVKNFFINAWNAIKGVWDTVKGYFSDIWENIKTKASSALESIKGFFSGAWTAIKNVWSGVTGWFGDIWTGIKNKFSGVSTWFGDIFGGAVTKIKTAWNGIKEWFQEKWNGIKSVFTSAGTAISDGITGALKSTFNNFMSKAVGFVNKFIRSINSAINTINKIPGVNIGKLSELSVPQLATGGIVTDSILANIGERGREAVLPLENNTGWMDALADRIAARNGPSKIVLQVDGRELGWATIEQINAITKQTGGLQLVL